MGTDTDWIRVKELFGATFEAAPDERERLLSEEPDHAVRERVQALLIGHDVVTGPLDRPPLSDIADVEPTRIGPVVNLVGRVIGPYRVIREIGRGGMGVVYEAVRADEQFSQRVAIKTLLVGAGSEIVLRRFRQERQILAGLQHPNIAQLFDGGVTTEGLPYFVLEYVEGQPIDKHCALHNVPLRARLDLFRQAVAAVQHAHRQLIIHRDLKPNNILVTTDGVAKLVDFGIAKLLQRRASEETTDGHRPLTIAYASPEQVRAEPITTGADVYSLGVVLYRLLTGRIPIDVDSVSLDRAVNAVCYDTPTLPSEVATPDAARSMGLSSADRLRRTLHGDLDAIVMMALRKEPERRYATAQAMADDVQRYLRGLPVMAAPDTAGYRLAKFVRRRRGLVVGSAVAVASVLIGSAVALFQARAARVESRRAAAVSGFLQSIIGAGDASAGSTGPRLGPSATVAELLDSASRRLPTQLKSDPLARSAIHLALGHAYLTQERWLEAEQHFQTARDLVVPAFGERRLEVARAYQGLAEIAAMRGSASADSLARLARSIFENVGATNTTEYARTLRLMTVIPSQKGNFALADSLLTEAMEVYDRLGLGPSIDRAMTLADRTGVREALGSNLEQTRNNYARALAMMDSVPGSEVVEKAYVLWYVARMEAALGNAKRADSLAFESLRVAERAAGRVSMPVAQQLAQLAQISRERGDLAAGRPYLARAIDILRQRPDLHPLVRERILTEAARYHWASKELAPAESLARAAYDSRIKTGNPLYIAESGQLLGALLRDQGRYGEAEPVLLTAYRASETVVGRAHGYTQFIAGSIVRLYYAANTPAKAEPFLKTMPDSVQKAVLAAVRSR